MSNKSTTLTEAEAAAVLKALSPEFAKAYAERGDIDGRDQYLAGDAVRIVLEGGDPRRTLILVGFPVLPEDQIPVGHFRGIREFWVVPTARGPRAYYYSIRSMRSFPLKYAVAELLAATGQATRVERPEWVGRAR